MVSFIRKFFGTGNELEEGALAAIKGDYATALNKFRPLAEQGNTEAQFSMGTLYDFGQGVPQDYKEAMRWYGLAAEKEYAQAQHHLGMMHKLGQGILPDNVLAYAWFSLAILNGYTKSINARDGVIQKMTPEQIAQAEKLVKEWF